MLKANHAEWNEPCGGICPTTGFEYDDVANRDDLSEVMVHIFSSSEAGRGIASSVESYYDSDAQKLVQSERIEAALGCARKILAGECSSYVYTGAFSPAGRT